MRPSTFRSPQRSNNRWTTQTIFTFATATQSRPALGCRGSYVLWVGPPLAATPRYVHFSWGGPAGPEAFKVRDYIGGKLQQHGGATRQPEPGFSISECSMSRDEVWAAAEERILARGELFHKVQDFNWWRPRLAEMTRNRGQS